MQIRHILIKIIFKSSLKQLNQIKTKFGWDGPCVVPFQNCCFIKSQNELNFELHYIAISSWTYFPGFSVLFFFQQIYTDYAYFEREKNSHKSLLIRNWAKMSFGWSIEDGCHYIITISRHFKWQKKKKRISWNCSMKI